MATAPPNPGRAGASVDDQARAALEAGRLDEVISVLMRGYGERVYRFCRVMLKGRELAAEVHQKVFVSAYQTLLEDPTVDNFESWIFRIARNRCLDSVKVRGRWLRRFRLGERAPDRPDPGPTAEHIVVGGQQRGALLDCLSRLAEHIRTAVVLRYLEGLTFEEMVPICGKQAATLQARVSRALPGLRKCLEMKGWTP